MRNLSWFLLPILIGCVSIPAPPVQKFGQNDPLTITINKSFDDSWSKIVRILTIDNDLPIKAIEKESGIITTDWVQYERPITNVAEVFVMSRTNTSTGLMEIRFNLKVSIESSGSQTNIIVRDHVEMLTGFGWITANERPVILEKIKEDIKKMTP